MRKILTLFMLVIGLVLVTGCTTTGGAVTVSVEDRDIEVALGDVYVINPQVVGLTVAPELAYSSSNPSIFEIDQNGIISPKSAGIAYLYVDVINAEVSRLKITVSIIDPNQTEDPIIEDPITEDPITEDPIDGIQLVIANGDLNIEVDQTIYLELLANGSEFLGEVVWVSSNMV